MAKRFGQNFLVDKGARERLFKAIEAGAGELIWEIGPGLGSITSLLLEAGHPIVAFEIDHGFSRALKELFGGREGFNLVEGDFLKTWKAEAHTRRPSVIFGNLPYNAALGIVADLLEWGWTPPRMVFTVQKEAARRMAAVPGTKDYSAFSVLCASVAKPRILYDLGPSVFWPQPRVASSVVALEPRAEPLLAQDRLGFSRFVRSAFSSRRKTLRNNLSLNKAIPPEGLDEALGVLGYPLDVRAEVLDPENLARLYSSIYCRDRPRSL
ncbi:MAG TPA: 16S rRNA (adenine(1518)-N(6)/adenine(1519)-N(6))-dimethyltransferase RsmA [Rectinemataceae bacterium]